MMYQDAIGIFRRYWAFIACASVASVLAHLVAASLDTSGVVITLIIPAFVSFYFYLMLLTDDPIVFFGKNATKTMPKLTYWIAFALPFLVLFIVMITGLVGMASLLLDPNLATFSASVLGILSFALCIALFGTMIPAAVANHKTGFMAALGRSRQTFWFVLGRLLVGPTLVTVLLLCVVLGIGMTGVPLAVMDSFADFSVGTALFEAMLTAGNLFTTAIVASILSRAYLRVEDIPRETSAPTT